MVSTLTPQIRGRGAAGLRWGRASPLTRAPAMQSKPRRVGLGGWLQQGAGMWAAIGYEVVARQICVTILPQPKKTAPDRNITVHVRNADVTTALSLPWIMNQAGGKTAT